MSPPACEVNAIELAVEPYTQRGQSASYLAFVFGWCHCRCCCCRCCCRVKQTEFYVILVAPAVVHVVFCPAGSKDAGIYRLCAGCFYLEAFRRVFFAFFFFLLALSLSSSPQVTSSSLRSRRHLPMARPRGNINLVSHQGPAIAYRAFDHDQCVKNTQHPIRLAFAVACLRAGPWPVDATGGRRGLSAVRERDGWSHDSNPLWDNTVYVWRNLSARFLFGQARGGPGRHTPI
jgi:hypothetical protein